MLNRLIDILVQFVGLFRIYTYVDQYEEGVVLRCGKYKRTVGPGFRWLWPALVPWLAEQIITANVKPEPMCLEIQSLITLDSYAVNLCIGMEYQIIDIKAHELDFEETADTIALLACGVVAESVQKLKFKELGAGWAKTLKAPINRKARKRGAEITEIALQDFSNGEAVRYWHEGIELG